MLFDDPQMLSLGLDEQECKNYSRNKITYNKLMSKIQAKARQKGSSRGKTKLLLLLQERSIQFL